MQASDASNNLPAVVSVRMGYGHLRASHALATEFGSQSLELDLPPLANDDERTMWERMRSIYEGGTRLSQFPVVGMPLRWMVDSLTDIPPLYPYRDLSAPNAALKYLHRQLLRGIGKTMVEYLRDNEQPLLTTYFAAAHVADFGGIKDICCVVTDSDINRVWAPIDPATSNIRFLAPNPRVLRRLRAYGVRKEMIEVTGFPLPPSLLGGRDLAALKKNLAARLMRLDPNGTFRDTFSGELETFLGYPLPALPVGDDACVDIVYAVGGAGAQTEPVARLLKGLLHHLEAGTFRVHLVAGVRSDTAEKLNQAVIDGGAESLLGGQVQVHHWGNYDDYFAGFNQLLARADVLWTKPSEMTFFGALGLAMVLAPPIGTHERYNRQWARENGAGLKQRNPAYAHHWLVEWLEEGVLAAAAWNGYLRLPKSGLYRIAQRYQPAR